MSDLMNPPEGGVQWSCTFVGAGRVSLHLSTRMPGDNAVSVIGMEMTRTEALDLAARLTREAARR